MTTDAGHPLIDDLLDNPRLFDESGRAYELLQAYFSGLPIDTLVPLVQSENIWIQRSATFIAAELGKQAQPLLEDVLPLLGSKDRHVQNYAMEVLTVCCEGEYAEWFAHVAKKLESDDEGTRLQAMDLVANADHAQLQAAARFFARQSDQQEHHRGLRALVAADGQDGGAADLLLEDSHPLLRRYGEIVAKRAGNA